MDQARARLGDDDVLGGEIFTNSVLLPHAQQAVRELWRVLRGAQDPFVLADAYYILPANVSVLDPATAGLNDFPEPEAVEWATAGTPIAITSSTSGTAADGTPIVTVTTSVPHNVQTGQQVFTYNIPFMDQFNSPNGMWTVTKIDATNVTLNGCSASISGALGGTLVGFSATSQFLPMDPQDYIWPIGGGGVLGQTQAVYAWEGGVLKFIPSSQARQLRLLYRQSGAPSDGFTSIIPIDDTQDFIAARMASLAAPPRGLVALSQELKMEALGPSGEPDGSGGLLGQLLRADIRNLQRRQYRWREFRPRRNRQDHIIY
jgi:hypothetical protein